MTWYINDVDRGIEYKGRSPESIIRNRYGAKATLIYKHDETFNLPYQSANVVRPGDGAMMILAEVTIREIKKG